MPFEFERLAIPEVLLVKPRVFGDDRGFFLESYKHSEFAANGINEHFVQDNYSKSAKGVLRGLHYQIHPKAQGKLVRCVRGVIFDVAVDIRKGSPHYAAWVGAELSDRNHQMMFVPPGFAHAFLVLSEDAEVLYKCTEEYAHDHERGIIWNDPAIGISWQIKEPALSPKDKVLPLLRDAENNFIY